MRYFILSLFIGILLLPGSIAAQDQRTLSTKIADVLNQVPTRDLNQRNRVAEEMLQMGSQGLDAFTALIAPDGSSDDSRARAALNGLALYAGQPGKEAERQLVSNAFLAALERSREPLVKAFFLYHLPFFGKGEIVAPVTGYLNHPDLADDAVQALVAIHEPAAAKALLDAYPKASDALKPVVLQGIAVSAPPSAEAFLRSEAASSNPAIRRQALRGLAALGNPASEKTVLAAAKQANFGYEPSEATRSLLLYTEALAKNNHLAQSKALAALILKSASAGPHYTTALSALDILTEQFGMDAFDMVLAALDHPRADYRAAALQSAARIRDVSATRRLIAKAESAGPELKAQLIAHLGREKQGLAKDLIARNVNAADSRLRAAALGAAAALHGKNALPTLLEAAQQTRSAEEQTLLFALLNPLAAAADAPALQSTLANANAPGKGLLIDLLAARHASAAFAQVLGLCGDADASVSTAAFRALPNLAQPKDLPQLIALLGKTQDAERVAHVQQALVALAHPKLGAELQSVWSQQPTLRAKLLGAFPRIGGKELLALVQEAGKDASLKTAAFKALTQWQDMGAAPQLYDAVAQGDAATRQEAWLSLLRILGQSALPDNQKVLQYHKLLDLAKGQPNLQRQALSGLGRIKSFPALITVAPYLDQPELQSDAAWVISRLALPASDGKAGLYGDVPRAILEKSIAAISGPESEYAKENMRNWLRQMPKDAGFVSLFNGKDLSGWQGLVGNPYSRAAMTPEQLAKAQVEADARLPQNWSVRDGEIRFTGSGFENLCTLKEYGDIEMYVEWRIDKEGDSGIYLRGTPQVQIWDTSLVKVGAQVGSGGLYNNQKNPSKPTQVADNPVGEWNNFFIRMLGDKVSVYLNGQLVTDQVTLENYWDRSRPLLASGPLELQAHGTNLAFRNIYVREIKSANYSLTPQEEAEGYTALFNGKDLSGWVGNKVDYKVVDQVILIDPSGGGRGNLYTEKEYADFSFRFEFQLTPGANNGIGIRTPLEGDAAYVGMEIQVLDNTSPIYANLQPYQYHGSVYGVIPAKREFLRPVGQWNEEEIRIQGNRIRVTLNGTVIVEGDLYEASKNGTMDKNEHPGLKRKSGHIGFLGHGSEVRFRNIRIKEL